MLGAKADLKLLSAVGIAQFLSFLLCITGITSTVLSGKSIYAPATQSLVNYALIASTCGVVHLYQHGWRWHSSNPWYIYLLLAFMDVEGNFLVTKAYQYTSITSVALLDCFTIPAVMMLSYFVFRSRYLVSHVVGAALCVLGLTLLVLTDSQSETGGPNPVLGDVLVICGACVYAICNVTQEQLLTSTSQWELLAYSGCFGTLIGGAQAAVLEHGAWTSGDWDAAAVCALLGFAGALYCFSLLLPLVLQWGGSTVLNLSLLTSDLWAAGARGVFFGGFGGTGGYFVMALLAEVAGIGLYTLAGSTYVDGNKLPPSTSQAANKKGQEGPSQSAGSVANYSKLTSRDVEVGHEGSTGHASTGDGSGAGSRPGGRRLAGMEEGEEEDELTTLLPHTTVSDFQQARWQGKAGVSEHASPFAAPQGAGAGVPLLLQASNESAGSGAGRSGHIGGFDGVSSCDSVADPGAGGIPHQNSLTRRLL